VSAGPFALAGAPDEIRVPSRAEQPQGWFAEDLRVRKAAAATNDPVTNLERSLDAIDSNRARFKPSRCAPGLPRARCTYEMVRTIAEDLEALEPAASAKLYGSIRSNFGHWIQRPAGKVAALWHSIQILEEELRDLFLPSRAALMAAGLVLRDVEQVRGDIQTRLDRAGEPSERQRKLRATASSLVRGQMQLFDTLAHLGTPQGRAYVEALALFTLRQAEELSAIAPDLEERLVRAVERSRGVSIDAARVHLETTIQEAASELSRSLGSITA
jgi:hypothetical protein